VSLASVVEVVHPLVIVNRRRRQLVAFDVRHGHLKRDSPLFEFLVVLELRNNGVNLLHALLGRGDLILLDLAHVVRVLSEVRRQTGLVTKFDWQELSCPGLGVVDEQ